MSMDKDNGLLKNKRIAIFANGWSTDYLEQVVEGIKKEAAKDDVDIFVFMTYINWGEPEMQGKCQLNIFHLPNPHDFDGAIVLANTFNLPCEADRVLNLFQKSGIPMVSTEVQLPNMACVGTDNVTGMRELAEHLVNKHNVKKIVYVSGIAGNAECAIRKKVLMEVLEEHGLSLVDDVRCNFSFYEAARNIADWLNAGNSLPEAFVCANDHMALGIISELHKMGIEVPDDVLVTGFDYIKDARISLPLVSTVSRIWDKLGGYAYEELMRQIKKPDPTVNRAYDTTFIPSESCKCSTDSSSVKMRHEKFRIHRNEQAYMDMQDVMLQNLRFALSHLETAEEFNDICTSVMGSEEFFGKDFCICVNPWIFNEEDKHPKRIRGYNKEMNILYEKKNGISRPLRTFKCKELYPDYKKVDGESNVYVFLPLNHLNMVIGYVALKNYEKIIYGMRLRRLQADMNPTFIFIKQYIHAQQNNRKLRDIYMTDFLTGMYNRTGCETEIFSYIENHKKKKKSLVLLFADINYMKYINDIYGHLNGDTAIKAAAEAMREALTGEWLFGRYGGDEYIAVGSCEDGDVDLLRQEISDSIKKSIEKMKLAFPLSVSVGCCIINPDDNGTIDDYIKIADDSMYEEKERAHKELTPLVNQNINT